MTASLNHEADQKRAARHGGSASDVIILCAEEQVRDVIAYWLSSQPARTFVADDGHHAARILSEGPCRWLVTDRVLPPWPGLDSFRGLRAEHPHLRIAFVENSNVHDWILARVTGATALLKRPLTRQTVIDALAEPQS